MLFAGGSGVGREGVWWWAEIAVPVVGLVGPPDRLGTDRTVDVMPLAVGLTWLKEGIARTGADQFKTQAPGGRLDHPG